MNVRSLTRGLCSAAAATTLTIACATIAFAETITVTDIAGRVVEVEKILRKLLSAKGA
jgi:iron complex transport system substrate-binding protein